MSRKRTLYLSELLTRCTNKKFQVTIHTKSQVLKYTSIKEAKEELSEMWLWNYQVIAYRIVQNLLEVLTKDTN